MALKLSMWTSFFMELSPEDALRENADAGWKYAELSHEHSRVLVERGNPVKSGEEFRKFADECGVKVPQGHLDLPVDIAPTDETARRTVVEGLKPWLDLYVAAGIRDAVLHPGGKGRNDTAERLKTQLKSLEELTRHVSGTGLVICLENCRSGEALKPILENTDPAKVAVCFDTGHMNLEPENQGEFIRWCGKRLRALHLAENDKTGDQHNMPHARNGTVPWDEAAAALKEIGYKGMYNYEVPGERTCPIAVRRLKMRYLKELSRQIFSK